MLIGLRLSRSACRLFPDRGCGFSPTFCRRGSMTMDAPEKGGVMEILWTIVTFAFVIATLAVVGLATYRFFGGGHTPQH